MSPLFPSSVLKKPVFVQLHFNKGSNGYCLEEQKLKLLKENTIS